MTIEEIDRELRKRISKNLEDRFFYLTNVIDWLIDSTWLWELKFEDEVKPITEFLTDDMRTSLTDIVDAFGTPEALVSYLVNAPEGQEEAMLDLLQLLFTMTFERGLP